MALVINAKYNQLLKKCVCISSALVSGNSAFSVEKEYDDGLDLSDERTRRCSESTENSFKEIPKISLSPLLLSLSLSQSLKSSGQTALACLLAC
jgi:hypothetical protein